MKRAPIAIIVSMGLILPLSPAWAAPDKAAPKTENKKTAVPQVVPQKEIPKDKNEETLFNTLKETLEENRKFRALSKEMQDSLQQKIVENESLKKELHKLENMALERNFELNSKTKELETKLSESAAGLEKFQKEKEEFYKEKKQIETDMAGTREENEKLKKTLSSAVLEEEKAAILKTAKENESVAQKAAGWLNKLSNENQLYRTNLVAAHYEMGNMLFSVKRYKEAAVEYEKVLELDKANAWAYYNLAVIEDYYLNNPQSAYLHYQQYLNYKPLDEAAQEVRRRILDLNMLQKISPETPLKADFERFHEETRNVKF